MKLGIDIGRVLISPDSPNGRADTSFIGGSMQAALATPAYDGMFEAVPQLVQLFKGQVWLVSKCGPKVQEKTKLWLKHHAFFSKTGVPSQNLRFCLERPQKAIHCEELGITHFIDDRMDVLVHLKNLVPNRYLFGPQKANTVIPHDVTPVLTWAEALIAVSQRVAVDSKFGNRRPL